MWVRMCSKKKNKGGNSAYKNENRTYRTKYNFLIGRSGTDGCECEKTNCGTCIDGVWEIHGGENEVGWSIAESRKSVESGWHTGNGRRRGPLNIQWLPFVQVVPLAQKAVIEYLKETGLFKIIMYLYSLPPPYSPTHIFICFFISFLYIYFSFVKRHEYC